MEIKAIYLGLHKAKLSSSTYMYLNILVLEKPEHSMVEGVGVFINTSCL